ncbi:MAG: outer membrane beta-barrel protein [Rhodothermales bacterium]
MNNPVFNWPFFAASLCLLTSFATPSMAQDAAEPDAYSISGFVYEKEVQKAMPGVNVFLINRADTTLQFGGVTNEKGLFRIVVPENGAYAAAFSFIGFETLYQPLDVKDQYTFIGTVLLEPAVVDLDQIVVEDMQQRVVLRGDTTEYNADAFKVNPDANAADLIAKMPGILVEDGEVQAQGENVGRVLVDGREFFGNDPNAALQNMPAEIIEKIQVFDRMSDQAQFTGFDDGNSEKTINIVTRSGMSNGQFGKLYGGYGSETRYISGGNLNIFDGDRRISIIGLSNNVNQQNFTTEDLLGVVGNTRQRGGGGFGGGFRRGGAGGGGGRPRGGGGGGLAGGRQGGALRSDPGNFLVGNQGGINQTSAIGVNYSDSWGENLDVTGSYFFNTSDNSSDVFLDRTYFLTDLETQLYNETNNAQSENFNHRFSGRFRYTIDEANSIIFTPRLSFQKNDALSNLAGINTLLGGTVLSGNVNDYTSNNAGYTSSSNLLYRHQFKKQGRTISANVGVGLNDRSGDASLFSSNEFFDTVDSLLVVDQFTENEQRGVTLSSSIAYTEPIGQGQLMFNYSPSVSNSDADRTANILDEQTGLYTILDPVLSNVFESQTVRQRAGVNYMMRRTSGMLSFGVDVQDENLSGDQTFPVMFGVERNFQSILPRAMFMYRPSRSKNLRIFYRTSTNTPSISQLQNVVDNTNPLQLTSGNPDLKQSYSHSFVARFNTTNATTGRVFMGFASLTQTNDNIGTASTIAIADTMIVPGVMLSQGSQFSRPINVDGYWNARSFFTVGLPAGPLKSNVNINAGYTFSRSPGSINGVENISDVHGLNGGAVIGSNISERVDFTLSYALNFSAVTNTVYPELDANYLFHKASAKVNLLLGKSWVFDTNLNLIQYTGLGEAFDQNNLVWNAGIGYKFLKGNGGEVKLIVADILNQNNSVSRSINEFYVEDNTSNVLERYVLLNFTYKLKNFRL